MLITKEFKFFQKIKIPRTENGVIKLKDPFNRNKNLILNWSEFPYDGDDSDIQTFQGNILDFYNFVKNIELTRLMNIKVYEIFKQHRGYFDTSLVFGNRNRYNAFISRKFYLTIKYSLHERI
jgi:hypothetical protein